MDADTPTSAFTSTGIIRHPRCNGTWTGLRTAHCPRCCTTFSGTSAFERHQNLDEGILICQSPDKTGLVPTEKPWGVMWSWPSTDRNPWNPEDGNGEA